MNIIIDGVEYDVSKSNEVSKSLLDQIQGVNELIQQKNNELQIAFTAQIGYRQLLNRELRKIGSLD